MHHELIEREDQATELIFIQFRSEASIKYLMMIIAEIQLQTI